MRRSFVAAELHAIRFDRHGDAELAEKASIYGALTLYLDFINIFLYVVRLLGMNSRSRNN